MGQLPALGAAPPPPRSAWGGEAGTAGPRETWMPFTRCHGPGEPLGKRGLKQAPEMQGKGCAWRRRETRPAVPDLPPPQPPPQEWSLLPGTGPGLPPASWATSHRSSLCPSPGALSGWDGARGPRRSARMLPGHLLSRGPECQQLTAWKKPNLQLIRTSPRNKITSFKTK